MTEGTIIQELIGLWNDYAKKRSDHSIKAFSKWLYTSQHTEEQDETVDIQQKKMELGRVFGRIINFTEMWGKLAFKDLPIKQFEDYGILTEVKYKGSPSKNEVASLLLNEKSTAFEIIKRLIRDGMLQEESDPDDKRIRRVKLTKYGHEVQQQAEQQAAKVSRLLVGDSQDEEILSLLSKFHELDRFHTANYEKGGYDTIDDLL